uniref:Resolvase/invertase-type recombinase catalytic domain-containing protein n=1 Tax=uncultured prokaryote TaxID=198431 RepID=A0A0H5QFJ2_9ZZZZ|nr:hypothetical protein [uncultured prokaryote]
MRVGYIRVSSLDQNPDRQIEDLKAQRVEKLFIDQVSGKNVDRPELQKMLSFVREGDSLYVHSLDRLARNLADLLNIVQDLTGRGVSVHFLGEKLDFDTGKVASPTSKLMLSMIGAFAEFERSMIRRRQAEGIALAKERGVYRGRQRSVTDEQIESVRKQMALGVPLSVAVRKVGISRATAYKYLRLLNGEQS